MQTNVIYCGDNLIALRELSSDSVDLVCMDPPFFSASEPWLTPYASHNAQVGIDLYIEFMRPRLQEAHRILRRNGSFYCQCGTYAGAYIRVLLDEIFGINNFQSEIVWPHSLVSGRAARTFANNHNVILFYTKSEDFTFNRLYTEFDHEDVSKFQYVDEDGQRYRLVSITSSASPSMRPNLTFEFLGITRTWRFSRDRLQEEYQRGNIVQAHPEAVPRLKQYLSENLGRAIGSIWDDIKPVTFKRSEMLGYFGQMPLALAERIIKASSNEGDIVLDPFCGSGTILHAATKLRRQWIGIESSPVACRLTIQRLSEQAYLVEGKDFVVRDLQRTKEVIRAFSPMDFESWVLVTLGSLTSRNLQIAQVLPELISPRFYSVNTDNKPQDALFAGETVSVPLTVKNKDAVTAADVRSFYTALRRQQATQGVFVAFGFSEGGLEEIAKLSEEHDHEIYPLTVAAILDAQQSLDQ